MLQYQCKKIFFNCGKEIVMEINVAMKMGNLLITHTSLPVFIFNLHKMSIIYFIKSTDCMTGKYFDRGKGVLDVSRPYIVYQTTSVTA